MPEQHSTAFNYIKRGFYTGVGFSLGVAPILIIGLFFVKSKSVSPQDIFNKALDILITREETLPEKMAPNFLTANNPYINLEYNFPKLGNEVTVRTVSELVKAIAIANREGGTLISLEPGIYTLKRTLDIRADNIILRSSTGRPEDVIIQGTGMSKRSKVKNLIRVIGKYFVLSGITLQKSGHHLIQVAGEYDADNPVIRDCILLDAYQQMIKVSYDMENEPETSSDFGLIENCTFKYTAGIGPNYYIGGIDAHGANGWLVRGNKFKDIASPSVQVAEHAIHFWNNTHNNIIENNLIEDSDRGIGFGLELKHHNLVYSNLGGEIRNNTIIHTDNNDPFADTGIVIERSPNTIIMDNNIWLGHSYSRAIEYRFPLTKNALIKRNLTNKSISSRNGGEATLEQNNTDGNLEDILEKYIAQKPVQH